MSSVTIPAIVQADLPCGAKHVLDILAYGDLQNLRRDPLANAFLHNSNNRVTKPTSIYDSPPRGCVRQTLGKIALRTVLQKLEIQQTQTLTDMDTRAKNLELSLWYDSIQPDHLDSVLLVDLPVTVTPLFIAAEIKRAKIGCVDRIWTFIAPSGRRCAIALLKELRQKAYSVLLHLAEHGRYFIPEEVIFDVFPCFPVFLVFHR
jgi:hypothetical protein